MMAARSLRAPPPEPLIEACLAGANDNARAYVGADPINASDPSGMYTIGGCGDADGRTSAMCSGDSARAAMAYASQTQNQARGQAARNAFNEASQRLRSMSSANVKLASRGGGSFGGGGASGTWMSDEEASARVRFWAMTGHSLPEGLVMPDPATTLLNADPIGSALKADAYHRAAAFMLPQAAFFARYNTERGRDGTMYHHYRLDSGMNGRPGIFHYVVDRHGRLTHQQFEPRP